jgi:hypothetical protein
MERKVVASAFVTLCLTMLSGSQFTQLRRLSMISSIPTKPWHFPPTLHKTVGA